MNYPKGAIDTALIALEAEYDGWCLHTLGRRRARDAERKQG